MTNRRHPSRASQSETVLGLAALRRSADIFGMRLPLDEDPELCRRWLLHLQLLYVWNEKINLTAIRDPIAGLERHLLESLAGLPHLESETGEPKGCVLADVGSGNGYPGLPLLLALPQCRGLLYEASQRKADFLRAVCRKLDLSPRVSVIHERVDSVADVIARASGPVRLVFRGLPEPKRWLREAAAERDIERCVAWLAECDAAAAVEELSKAGRRATAVPLRSHRSGALLVMR